MNDRQMDRLFERLSVTAEPGPDWIAASAAQLLPNVRAARRWDASPLGRATLVLVALRRLLRDGPSRRTLLSIAIALLLTGALAAYLVGGATRQVPGGPTGLLILAADGGVEAIDIRQDVSTRLLPDGSGISAVSRSPDGRLFAFRVPGTAGDHYEVMDVDGSARRRVASDLTIAGTSCNDAWSPDSRMFASGVDVVGGERGRIVVIDATDGTWRFVSPGGVEASCPIWSSDAQWIAYTTSDRMLTIVQPDGSGRRPVASRAGGASSWSADGWIYFDLAGGGVQRANVATGAVMTVSDPRLGIGHAPALAPDGSQLALLYFHERDQIYDLYLSKPDGSEPRRAMGDVLAFGGWSTNGQYLLVVWSPPAGSSEQGGLVAVAAQSGEQLLLRAFSSACPATLDSPCFRDIAWGTSRP